MKKRLLAAFLILAMMMGLLSGCKNENMEDDALAGEFVQGEQDEEQKGEENDPSKDETEEGSEDEAQRKSLKKRPRKTLPKSPMRKIKASLPRMKIPKRT